MCPERTWTMPTCGIADPADCAMVALEAPPEQETGVAVADAAAAERDALRGEVAGLLAAEAVRAVGVGRLRLMKTSMRQSAARLCSVAAAHPGEAGDSRWASRRNTGSRWWARCRGSCRRSCPGSPVMRGKPRSTAPFKPEDSDLIEVDHARYRLVRNRARARRPRQRAGSWSG